MKPAAAPTLQAGRSVAPRSASAAGTHQAAAPALRPGHVPNQEGVKEGQFRTNDGRIVDLPDDLSAYDAACLEAEATAAKQRLGRGPPPRPVPDVKAQPRKPEPKEPPRPAGSKKKGAKPPAVAPSVGAAGAMLAKAGTSPVARYLANKGAPTLARGMGRLANLKTNETTHDNASQKLAQSEAAVIIPKSEEQSKSNDAQVGVVGARPAPAADERRGKAALAQALAENAPRTIEDVDDFKSNRKAQHTSAEVLRVVQADSGAVLGTFGDLKQTPPPTPTDHVTEALPPPEIAPGTAPMQLGQGAVAPLQKEHTDTSAYTREVDGKLVEEGITQEQLDMVDSGDLAEANKEKKGMASTAVSEPLAIQRFAIQEAQSVNASLQHQEKAGRSRMQARRKQGLGQTGKKQSKTQLDLQKKREEVASQINAIYQSAQDLVKRRLTDLETTSARRFDEGNARATRAFEDNVNREIDAFKDDRYSGWTGPYYRVRDWVKGIDELPEVEAIFTRNRDAYVRDIEALVAEISAEQKRVIAECKATLAKAKTEIKEYVDSLGPALKDIGKQAADEMNNKLAELDEYIKGQEEELKAQLKDKQTAAIRAIDQKIEKMKESMSGLVGKLKRLLLWAAKKFFGWALGKFGVSLETIENVIDKGAAVLKAIFTKPIRFFGNLISAARLGFDNFRGRFVTHLKNAVFAWLGGALEGIEPPSSWDLKGILDFTFRMLGFTTATLQEEIAKLLPPSAVNALKTTFDLMQRIRAEGLSAVWGQLQEVAGDLKETLRAAVQDWLASAVIKRAVLEILKIFAPAGGLVAAVIGIYKSVVFFIKRAREIMRMVGSFLDSISEIAAGNVSAAADALEGGLARGIKLVIAFLTGYLGLDGITAQIRTVVERMRDRVRGMLAKVARWVVEMAKKAGKLALQAGVPQDPMARLQAAGREAVRLSRLFAAVPTVATLQPFLWKALGIRYGLTSLKTVQTGGEWFAQLVINPPYEVKLEGFSAANGAKDLKTQVTFNAAKLTVNDVTALVGKSMKAHPLSKDHPTGSDSTKDSHQNALMEQLGRPHKKGVKTPYKYIKGHLLNHHVGGPGEAFNLFPITAAANAKHLEMVERYVKADIHRGFVGSYEVNITHDKPSPLKTGRTANRYSLNSAIYFKYNRLDANLNPVKGTNIEGTILSEYADPGDENMETQAELRAEMEEAGAYSSFAGKGTPRSKAIGAPGNEEAIHRAKGRPRGWDAESQTQASAELDRVLKEAKLPR